MNVLRYSLAGIRTRFYARVFASILFYIGYGLLAWMDWRIALGVFLAVVAHSCEKDARGAS